MDKIPRRTMGVLLLAGMAVMGIITGQQTTMTALIVTTFILNTIIYMYVCYASAVYVPEMWPTSAKLSGSGFCNAMGRVSNIFFPFLVTNVAANIGASGVFVLITIVAIVIAVSIVIFGVETRGESVETIGDVD
jgi:putative MFS transporter